MHVSHSHKRLLAILLPRIAAAQEHAGLSQNDLAEVSGVHIRSFLRWHRGTAVPALIDLVRLAHACDVSLAFFFVAVDNELEAILCEAASTPLNSI